MYHHCRVKWDQDRELFREYQRGRLKLRALPEQPFAHEQVAGWILHVQGRSGRPLRLRSSGSFGQPVLRSQPGNMSQLSFELPWNPLVVVIKKCDHWM
jgi:hypothetical protein